jgi:hypothetical protein
LSGLVIKKQPNLYHKVGLVPYYDPPRVKIPTKGVPVSFGHPNWRVILNMMIGIRKVIAEYPDCDFLYPKHYTERVLHTLGDSFVTDFSLADMFSKDEEKMNNNEFVTYAPLIFVKIRNLFKITSDSYLVCLLGFLCVNIIFSNILLIDSLCIVFSRTGTIVVQFTPRHAICYD